MNIITLWKLNDWGMYNQRDEAILSAMSHRKDVGSVQQIGLICYA